MGALREAAGLLSVVRSGRNGRCGAPAVRRQPHPGQRDLELPFRRRPGPLHARSPQPGGNARRAPADGEAIGRRPPPASSASGQEACAIGQEACAGGQEACASGQEACASGQEACASGQARQEASTIDEEEKVGRVPFLRFSRDKRGYEHFYLVQPTSARRGKQRQRILYWFRTPPNVKVGREPFAEHVRRALEAQYPDVRFDWETLVATPIPPPETDHWRERRRAERAARQVADAEPAVQEPEAEGSAEEVALAANAPAPDEPALAGGSGSAESVVSVSEASESTSEVRAIPEPLRRRGRRRGRRNHRPGSETAPPVDRPEGK